MWVTVRVGGRVRLRIHVSEGYDKLSEGCEKRPQQYVVEKQTPTIVGVLLRNVFKSKLTVENRAFEE